MPDQFENLVGRAMLATTETERDLHMARYTCKAAASAHMFCPHCQNILDQKTTVVVTGSDIVEVMCMRCALKVDIRGIAQRMADEFPSAGAFTVETWNNGKEEFTCKSK